MNIWVNKYGTDRRSMVESNIIITKYMIINYSLSIHNIIINYLVF